MIRRMFVISDLHLGGRPDEQDEQGKLRTGYQFCHSYPELIDFIDWIVARGLDGVDEVELVLNGDIVDFLADDDYPGGLHAAPWTGEPEQVKIKLAKIRDRTAVGPISARTGEPRNVFTALRALALTPRFRLTMLLGNHDLELALPQVRSWLREELGGEAAHVHFVYDGEAYTQGDLLIEHGNRYDAWNQIDHSRLRQERAMHSRGLEVRNQDRGKYFFIPPPGTFLVTRFMNRIKRRYRFVDLLKPETEAVLPMLLAVAPEYGPELSEVFGIVGAAVGIGVKLYEHGMASPGQPKRPGDLARDSATPRDDLGALLQSQLGARAQPFLKLLGAEGEVPAQVLPAWERPLTLPDETPPNDPAATSPVEGDLANWQRQPTPLQGESRLDKVLRWLSEKVDGLAELGSTAAQLAAVRYALDDEERLRMLHTALDTLGRDDASFALDAERPEYLDGAAAMARQGGFRVILFGHTHLPKHIVVKEDHAFQYLNTGTWTDVMRLPFDPRAEYETIRETLQRFLAALSSNRFAEYSKRYLTYAELLYDSQRRCVLKANLCSYCGPEAPRQAPLSEAMSAQHERKTHV